MNRLPGDGSTVGTGASHGDKSESRRATPECGPSEPASHPEPARPTAPRISSAVRHALRDRFLADQHDAEYIEYTEAMARIGSRWRWRRERRRFLKAHAMPYKETLDDELRALL